MRIYSESNLSEFNAWSGAVSTKQRIIDEGKDNDFESLIDELYPDGIEETALNDILWHDEEWVFEQLGIEEEETEEEETE